MGALLLVALVAAPAAGATVVQAGTACPDTLPGQGPLKACFGEPFSEARPEGIGPSGAPDDDLSAALRRMASAPDPDTAAAARRDALDILEGNAFAAGSPLAGSAYEGISLLHWDAASKIQDVPAGGTVTVREVRFGDHAITDTARLHFEDPARPFRIRYEITELGTSMGGDLAPAALQSDGGTPTQSHVAGVTPLALPLLDLGTMQVGRFHDPVHKTFPLSDNNPQPERTRIGTEEVDVDMPAPSSVDVILDPDQRPDHHTLVALRPTDKPAPDAPAGKAAGIDTIGDAAPEKKLWTGIHALDPQAPTFLADAKAVASGDASLVGEMRVRNALPAGVITDPGADLYVVLLNNEVYVSANGLRLAPGAPLRVQFVNADDRPHDLSALQLHGRVPHIGALDWGSFLHDALTGVPGTLPAGERTPVQQLSLDDDAFELVVGDPDGGDQASAAIDIDRGPSRQTLDLGGSPDAPQPFALPLHSAEDADGNLWTALAGVDEVVRITPTADLDNATRLTVKLPGGNATAAAGGVLAPHGVVVAPDGKIWVTLTLSGQIARIDPAQVHDGTKDGVTIFDLGPCPQCRVPPPPDPQVPLRLPIQLDATQDGDGNTVVWFTEQGSDQIGALRVTPAGRKLNLTHFGCDCTLPTGIGLDRNGNVWYAGSVDNHIGRLTPDVTRPFSSATPRIDEYDIPSSTPVEAADIGEGAFQTSNPHSVAVDRKGRVWFTETETSKIGRLDPAQAKPGTTLGFDEFALPDNDFGGVALPADIAIDRAGTVYWSDEYGDMIGSITSAGDISTRWRPTERQSLTDAPLVDSAGNLWFAESSAAILNRISGVTAGNLRPGPLPVIAADTAAGTLTASGLREISSLDVAVRRGGRVVSQVDGVPVGAGGAARIGTGGQRWDLAAPRILAPGDVLTFTPHGTDAFAPFSFTIADVTATVGADGSVTGHAELGGAPVSGQVSMASASGDATAAVGPADGSFSATFDAAGPGTVTWSTATQAAVFRTVTAVTGQRAEPGGGDGGAGTTPPSGGNGATGTTPPSGSGGAAGTAPPAAGVTSKPSPCPNWLTRTRKRRSVFLLGSTGARLPACLGTAAGRGSGRTLRLRYGTGLSVTLRAGHVASFSLLDSSLRSRPDGAGVGSREAVLRKALGRLARDRRHHRLRAVLALTRTTAADIRMTMASGRRPRATRIDVTKVASSKLDRVGRALLRRIA